MVIEVEYVRAPEVGSAQPAEATGAGHYHEARGIVGSISAALPWYKFRTATLVILYIR